MSYQKQGFVIMILEILKMEFPTIRLVISDRSSYKISGWGIRWRPIDRREAICLLHKDNLV